MLLQSQKLYLTYFLFYHLLSYLPINNKKDIGRINSFFVADYVVEYIFTVNKMLGSRFGGDEKNISLIKLISFISLDPNLEMY